MNSKYLSILIGLLICFTSCYSQGSGIKTFCYNAWNNGIDQLMEVPSDEIVPVPLDGDNYRVIKVLNNSSGGLVINNIMCVSKIASVKVYELPVMKNYSFQSVLDVMIPFSGNSIKLNKNGATYFLLKITGLQKGTADLITNISIGGVKRVALTKRIKVGSMGNYKLNLNVWSYFNYPLLKGVRQAAIYDLQNHNANVLVIPPTGMPSPSSLKPDGAILKTYIKDANNFDYYLLFLNYNTLIKPPFLFSSAWEARFLNWCATIKEVFKEEGIPLSKVLLYPYDEPTPAQAEYFVRLWEFCNKNNVGLSFYSTVVDPNSAFIANYTKVVQSNIKSATVAAVKKHLGKQSQLWLYDIKAQSRDIRPQKYLQCGWQAYTDGATGIGVWNYGDVSGAFTSQNVGRMLSSQNDIGTWQLPVLNKVKDYSLVYRQGNNLYSSIRWEALSYSKCEYGFLKLYEKKYGSSNAMKLASDLMNNKESLSDWEKIKVSLLEQ